MDKYYGLLLNNCYDYANHYITLRKITMFPNILEKKYTTLKNVESDFMSLDNTIKICKDAWTVYGSFPVIGIMKDNKMYDLITDIVIPYTSNPKSINGISYAEKHYLNKETVSKLLKLLDPKSIERYTDYLNKITKFSKDNFYNLNNFTNHILVPKNINIDINPLITVNSSIGLIDMVTKTKIILLENNMLTNNLCYTHKKEIDKSSALEYALFLIDNGIDKYINTVKDAKNNTEKIYRNYISMNENKQFKERVSHKIRIKTI